MRVWLFGLVGLVTGCSTVSREAVTAPLEVPSVPSAQTVFSPPPAAPAQSWLGFVARLPNGDLALCVPDHDGGVRSVVLAPALSRELSAKLRDEPVTSSSAELVVETLTTAPAKDLRATWLLTLVRGRTDGPDGLLSGEIRRVVPFNEASNAVNRYALELDYADHALGKGLAAALLHLEKARQELLSVFGDEAAPLLEAYRYIDGVVTDVARALASGDPFDLAQCVRGVEMDSRGPEALARYAMPRYEIQMQVPLNRLVRDALRKAFLREHDPDRARSLGRALYWAEWNCHEPTIYFDDAGAHRTKSPVLAEVRRRFPELATRTPSPPPRLD